MVFYITFFWYL